MFILLSKSFCLIKKTYIVVFFTFIYRNSFKHTQTPINPGRRKLTGRCCQVIFVNTMKPPNSGHLRVLKNLFVIERSPLLGGNLKKIGKFRTKHFARYSWHVRYLNIRY